MRPRKKKDNSRKGIGGVPTKYVPEFTTLAFEMGLCRYTEEVIAEILGVCSATVVKWKKKHPEFKAQLKRGRMLAQGRVVNALFEKAVGKTYIEKKPFVVAQGQGMGSKVEFHDIEVVVQPDTTAAKTLLAAWDPENYGAQNKLTLNTQVNNYGDKTVVLDPNNLTKIDDVNLLIEQMEAEKNIIDHEED